MPHENANQGSSAEKNVMIEEDQWTLRITRIFDAPRELVWRAWTEDERLMQWYCPKEFATLFVESDLKPGGLWRAGMRAPNGNEFVRQGEFREIEPPEKLVFTHAWAEDRPEHACQTTSATVVTLTLRQRGDQTEMIFEQVGFISEESRDSHEGGWSSSFDHLEAYLAGQ